MTPLWVTVMAAVCIAVIASIEGGGAVAENGIGYYRCKRRQKDARMEGFMRSGCL